MEWTILSRISNYNNFIKRLEEMYTLKNKKTNEYIYKDFSDIFIKKELASGVEGIVYKALFKKHKGKNNQFVIKKINLRAIKRDKGITKKELNLTPDELYTLFYTNKSFKKPSLIEIISSTLTNQLVFQNICPHFAINYYWDYQNNVISLYNEYINYTFESWSEQKHSNQVWFNALFQIMYALASIKRIFNMLHTDLHIGNILVQKIKKGGYWIYKLDNVDYYVPNLGYVFIISDFGFSWIPNKLFIPWYYKNRLQYITKNGQQFYDLNDIIDSIKQIKTIPDYFASELDRLFDRKELLVVTSKYYQNFILNLQLNYYEINNIDYPTNIDKSYSGLKNTIADKIYDIFFVGNFTKKKRLNIQDITYSYIIKNSVLIDTYSLDKPFDHSKLSPNFQLLLKKKPKKRL